METKQCYVRIAMNIPVILQLCFLVWNYYTYVYVWCPTQVTSVQTRMLYQIMYHIVLALLLWSYFKTIFTEPGVIPPKYKLPEMIFNEFKKSQLDSNSQNYFFRDYAERLSIKDFKKNDRIRFCDECKLLKPDRAHHCKICRTCVLKYDHHCILINSCVSYSNYKYYILCLSYGLLMCIYVGATIAVYYITFGIITSDTQESLHTTQIGVLFTSVFIVSIVILILITLHINLVSKNQTTYEYFHLSEEYKNRYNLGCFRNIQEVFGEEYLYWPFPINTSLGNGTSFQLSSDLYSII